MKETAILEDTGTQSRRPRLFGVGQEFTRRLLLRRAGLVASAVGLLSLTGALARNAPWFSRAVAPPDAWLLSAEDFTGSSLFEIQRLGQRETRDGGRTVQVILQGTNTQIFQSVVAFPSENAAHQAIQAINGETPGGWQVVSGAPAFGQESLVLVGNQGTQGTVSALFRQGRAVIRVTVVGTNDVAVLTPFARKAEEKTK